MFTSPSNQDDETLPFILLAEDSDDDAFFLEHTLIRTSIACNLKHVHDGAEATEFLERCHSGSQKLERPDLILLDLKMPRMNGFDVLEWIRNREFKPPLNVVVLSGSDNETDITKALRLGAKDYLIKPASVLQLQECLLGHLQNPPVSTRGTDGEDNAKNE